MRLRTQALLALPAGAALALFFGVPVAALAVDALSEGVRAFARVLALPAFWPSLGGSAVLTLAASTVSTAVGVAVALHLARLPERSRTLLSFVIALPLTFSGLIVAYGFILAYGRAGFFTQMLAAAGFDAATIGKALFTPVGLAFASSYYLIPRVVMSILPVLINFERAQFAAAAPLGAAFCLAAAVVFGAYGTALALVGTRLNILPLQLYSLISETGSDFPAAAALALLITAACSAIMTAGEWFGSRHERHL